MNKKYFDWDILERARTELSNLKITVDAVVGIGCGGLPIAVLAKHTLEKPLYLVEASSYTEEHKRRMLKFKNLNVPKSIKGKRVLLIDDIWDSGTTMKRITGWLEKEMGALVYPYVLVAKGMPQVQHGVMFMELCKTDDWIVFPWEIR